jgi:hypothetical protein
MRIENFIIVDNKYYFEVNNIFIDFFKVQHEGEII